MRFYELFSKYKNAQIVRRNLIFFDFYVLLHVSNEFKKNNRKRFMIRKKFIFRKIKKWIYKTLSRSFVDRSCLKLKKSWYPCNVLNWERTKHENACETCKKSCSQRHKSYENARFLSIFSINEKHDDEFRYKILIEKNWRDVE